MTKSERRLAAIVSADVVGYSRLMAEDEDATVRTLTAYREQVGSLVREHRGRLVDFSGDNFLSEFPSALEAVRCAIEIQRVLAARNADLPPEQKMEFRIGAHLGDIRVEGERIYGEGVNVAARLEGLAEPGGLCISRTVHEQVRRTPGLLFQNLGAQTLKNIPEPVEVYRVRWSGPSGGEPMTPGTAQPSVAVLPFANMSADPDQEYFADGMSDELINALTKVDGLRVIARTSAFSFKGTNADIATIGGRLQVSTVLEGSVRRSGDRLRITAQLIDVAGGHHLWSEVYNRPLGDVFEVQDEIARTIVKTIKPKFLGEKDEPLVSCATRSQEAYDLYLRAGDRIAGMNRWDTRAAIGILNDATALDEHFAGAWARLAMACCQMDSQFERGEQWHEQTGHALERALALDPKNAEAQVVRGRVLWTPRNGFRHREALGALEQALRLQPGSHQARLWHSLILNHVGLMTEAEEGIAEVREAEPADATVLASMAQNLLSQGRYEAAADCQAKALALDPAHFYSQIFRPTVLLYLDDLAGAEKALGAARQLLREDPLLDGNEALLWAKRGEAERAEEALARAQWDWPSVSHSHHAWHYAAAAYALLGRRRESIEKLRDAAASGLPNYPMFRDDPHLASLHAEPDMVNLLADLEREWNGYKQDFGRAF